MRHTKKLSEKFYIVKLKQRDDGKLIPEKLEGDGEFNFPADIESHIETVASWIKPGSQDDVSVAGDGQLEMLYMEIEQELEAANGEVSQKTLSDYADVILNGKQYEPKCSDGDFDRIGLVKEARTLVRQYQRIMKIASVVAEHQQAFLKSRALKDYNGLTYEGIASQIDDVSEATVRRDIHNLRFQLNHQRPIHVEDLFVRGQQAQLMSEVAELLKGKPKAGAPQIKRDLGEIGIHVSERLAGMVKSKICDPRFKAAMRTAVTA